MESYRNKIYFLAAWIVVCAGLWVNSSQAAEGQSSIRGLLYVSYSGDLSYDVMFAAGVEVSLIDGNGTVEKEFESLKQKSVPLIRAQETMVIKAIGDVRSPTAPEKRKGKLDALKREQEKLRKLRSDYENEIARLLAKTTIKKTKADIKGSFRFDGLSPGHYLVHARYELQGTDNKYFWFHAVDAKPGKEVEVTLNKSTVIHIYDLGPSEQKGNN
ncbi:MAG: hypothetical protein Q8S00_27090 [Deltaproteobacteria bacterium]|nr:hypothetical protein [Deltaproteobacteria bacterium]MDZ4346086.1 hypothetical protein [Candidatus Binatia bacterium]